MKKIVLGALLVASSLSAYALRKWNGRSEAADVCFTLHFDDEKKACLDMVRESKYFDRGAVAVCRTQNFVEDRVDCLTTIRDRYYEDFEVRYCAGLTFDDEKVQCLATSGQAVSVEPVQTPLINMRRISY